MIKVFDPKNTQMDSAQLEKICKKLDAADDTKNPKKADKALKTAIGEFRAKEAENGGKKANKQLLEMKTEKYLRTQGMLLDKSLKENVLENVIKQYSKEIGKFKLMKTANLGLEVDDGLKVTADLTEDMKFYGYSEAEIQQIKALEALRKRMNLNFPKLEKKFQAYLKKGTQQALKFESMTARQITSLQGNARK